FFECVPPGKISSRSHVFTYFTMYTLLFYFIKLIKVSLNIMYTHIYLSDGLYSRSKAINCSFCSTCISEFCFILYSQTMTNITATKGNKYQIIPIKTVKLSTPTSSSPPIPSYYKLQSNHLTWPSVSPIVYLNVTPCMM